MKLFHTSTSPFVRKAMICAILRGIEGKLEKSGANPWESPEGLIEKNPLSKIPCLVTDDGAALFDSPVVCEYLDSIGDAPKLFPPAGPARWRALRLQALADGILDAGIIRRMEESRPKEDARDKVIARQKAIMQRALAALGAEPPSDTPDIGGVAVACALGWVDFRYGDEDWKTANPKLSTWWKSFSQLPAVQQTVPVA